MTDALTTLSEPCTLAIPSNIPTGLENAGTEKMVLPRLSVVQSLSKSFKETRAMIGQIENLLTKDVFNGPIDFIILRVQAGAVSLVKKTGKLICRSDDGITSWRGATCKQCPYKTYWGNWDNGKPACSATKELVVIRRDTMMTTEPYVAIISMKDSQIGVAKQIINSAKVTRKPIYAKAYRFETQLTPGDGQEYYSWKVNPVGWVTQDEFNTAVRLFDLLETASIDHSHETEDDDKSDAPPHPAEASSGATAPIEIDPDAEDIF